MARFQPGDRVTFAGQEWIIAAWPANDAGMFTYYRDEGGTRTWGVAATSERVEKGEPVTEPIEPTFVRQGTLTDEQDLREIADE
jgi:hypothetical protein